MIPEVGTENGGGLRMGASEEQPRNIGNVQPGKEMPGEGAGPWQSYQVDARSHPITLVTMTFFFEA